MINSCQKSFPWYAFFICLYHFSFFNQIFIFFLLDRLFKYCFYRATVRLKTNIFGILRKYFSVFLNIDIKSMKYFKCKSKKYEGGKSTRKQWSLRISCTDFFWFFLLLGFTSLMKFFFFFQLDCILARSEVSSRQNYTRSFLSYGSYFPGNLCKRKSYKQLPLI